ncbi:hypothetical protein H5410_016120 [Solanum commersonii]|uniref:Uncharacterized protein n=1 Tax=Solanum commersonii TaxID=4109 RepID=A0A9J5ZVQ4_SOLCO|nr:hypothetical protein H5410_016120 [Solanum commersonii]
MAHTPITPKLVCKPNEMTHTRIPKGSQATTEKKQQRRSQNLVHKLYMIDGDDLTTTLKEKKSLDPINRYEDHLD